MPVQGEILDTSSCVPQPLWSCGGTAQSPHMLPPAPSGSLCASVPVPGHPCGPPFPSLLRVLLIPGVPTTHQVPITSKVPILPWGPHCPWGPHHPWSVHNPSRFFLLLGVPVTLRVPIVLGVSLTPHPWCPVVPLSPSSLGFPTPLGLRCHHCTGCPHNLQVLTVPGIPITSGVLIISQGLHYSLESLLPSASSLSLCSPLLLRTPGSHHCWDSHHPLVPITSMFPLSLCLHHPWHPHCPCNHHAPSPFPWVPQPHALVPAPTQHHAAPQDLVITWQSCY